MKFQYVFEKSNAWNQSLELTKEVHELDSRFHNYEKFDIIKKLRTGSVEITADIAVAATQFSASKQIKFSSKLHKKLTRLLSHLVLARELKFISSNEYHSLKIKADDISNYIHNLANKEVVHS